MGTVPLKSQRGYLLITVVVMLFLVASIAMLLNYDASISANTTTGELEAARADYVAEAAMQHALWRTGNNACMGDVTIPTTMLGQDSYTATITGAAAGTAHTLTADQDAWIRSDDVTINNGSNADQHIRFESGKTEHALTRFDLSSLPANARINSAVAWFYITPSGPGGGVHPEGPITVHQVTADWTESGATWDTMNGEFNNTVLATIPAQPADGIWVSFNLTGQVQAWANGQANYGILFASTAEGVHGKYSSREDGGNAPRLEVVVGSGPASPVNIQATGTLVNGTTRSLSRPLSAAYQPPVIHSFRPDAAESEDAEIWAQGANNNYGDATETWVSSASNDTTRSLLRFGVDAIPTGSRILGATLSLRRQSGSGSNQPVSAHRITNPWSENSVTWNRRESGTNWDTAGGDFESRAVATTPVGPVNQYYEWDITPLVQGWIDGGYPNYGVAMVAAIDGMAGERFYTSDQATPDRRPSLTISYACECGSTCMAAQGSGNVLMIIGNSPANPAASEKSIRDYLENWGYSVTYIQDDDSQGNFNAGMAANDAVFVSETVIENNVGTKLADATIGVVSAERDLNDELGIASASAAPVGDSIDVVDNSHFITSVFQTTTLPLKSHATQMASASGTIAPGAQVLAQIGSDGSLLALDKGATSESGGTVAGRRVLIPVGDGNSSWSYLTNYGRLVVQRSLAWAMGAGNGAAGPSILFVVGNAASPSSTDSGKKTLMESWGYTVTVIDDGDSQANFDTALAANDVIYVSSDISATAVGTKLTAATIGIVNEETLLTVGLGFSDDVGRESRNEIEILDNTHSITSGFALGMMTIVTSMQPLTFINNGAAPGAQVLAQTNQVASFFEPSLLTLEKGSELSSGGFAAGKRVSLPWGDSGFDINALNANGLTIMERAIEWAATAAAGGGPTAPIAHWKLDETSGTTAVDSIGGHDGVMSSGSWTSSGIIDGALILPGNAYVRVPHDPTLILNQQFTLSAWATASPAIGYHTIINKGTSGNNQDYWFGVWGDWLTLGFYTNGGFNYVEVQMPDWIPSQATHFAASFDNDTDEVRLYKNGVLLHTGSMIYEPATGSEDLIIGRSQLSEYWNGMLDDVRIYDRVLDATEIAQLASAGGGPIAHWKLDETSGTTAVDSVGGHNGTLVNMDPSTDWVPGQLSGGLDFDGSNDYIDVSSMNPMSYDDVTISAWYKSSDTGVSDDEYIFEHNDNFSYEVTFGPTDDGADDRLRFGFTRGGSGTWDPHYGTSDIVDQQWHHVVGVRTAGRIKIYVDGVEESDGADAHAGFTVTIDGDGPFIGDLPGETEQVHGGLDDVRLYDKALSASEIADLFTAGGGSGGGGGGCAINVLDAFTLQHYSGSDADPLWVGGWVEFGDSGSPSSEDERVIADTGGFKLQIADNDNGGFGGNGEGVWREVDLSGTNTATLSFKFQRSGLDNANDAGMLFVSGDGGTTWSPELWRTEGPGTDMTYQQVDVDISDYVASNTRIRFQTGTGNKGSDRVYFDDVTICAD